MGNILAHPSGRIKPKIDGIIRGVRIWEQSGGDVWEQKGVSWED